MKRQILTTLSVAIFIALQAQNYECIKPGAEYYYSDGENSKAILVDSVQNKGDTIMYFQNTEMTWNDTTGCFSRFGPSWIGKKIKQFPNGDHVFYNVAGESIRIRTQALPNETWEAYTYANGDYFEAKLVSVEVASFLEIQDTVKKIVFNLKDVNGINLPHSLNNSFLLISKNHGLVKTLNFKLFPDLTEYGWLSDFCHTFDLAGMSNPVLGIQNLSASSIFNITPGDEIHTETEFWYYPSNSLSIQTIYQYLDKTTSTNGDTLFFLIKRCARKTEYIDGVYELTLYDDTVSQQVVLSELSQLNEVFGKVIVDSLSPDALEYTVNTQYFYKTSDRQVKWPLRVWFSYAPHDCIYMIVTKDKPDVPSKQPDIYDFYIDGLGGPYHNYADFGVDIFDVVYYNKGGDEWGTPFNCDSLLVNIKPVSENVKSFAITPNPMKEMTKISIAFPEHENLSLRIYDLMGVKIYEKPFQGTEMIITKGELPVGVYVVSVSTPGSLRAIRKLIVE